MVFPHIEKDIISDWNFRQLCEKKGYKVTKEYLEYLEKNNLLLPISKTEYSSKYSKHQFYIVQFIKDHRYNINGFLTTYHNRPKNELYKVMDFFDNNIKEFDNKFQEYSRRFYDFFAIYNDISEYVTNYSDYTFNRINKITDNKGEYKKIIDDRTFLLETSKEYSLKHPYKLNKREITIIKSFMDKILLKYETYFNIYITTHGAKKKLKNIPGFEIINDFIEIFNVIEIFENINGYKLKETRLYRVAKAGTYSSCKICNGQFKKKKINQLTCGPICSKQNKNNHKKEARKKDPKYGA